MKLSRLIFATLLAGAVALPASAQSVRRDVPRSDMAAENDLIEVLGRTQVRGDGANGVPPGVSISYSVAKVNRCAPRIQMWAGREGTGADGPLGPVKALRMDRIAKLVEQGSNQLKVEFTDGSDLILATNSQTHRLELVNSLHAFGSACRNRGA